MQPTYQVIRREEQLARYRASMEEDENDGEAEFGAASHHGGAEGSEQGVGNENRQDGAN